MFEMHEYVRYGSYGLFQIVGVKQKTLNNGTVKDCYVLHGVQQMKTRIETPIDNPRLRKALNRRDIDRLIMTMPAIETNWITDKKKREEEFRNALRCGDCVALVRVMKTIYTLQEEKARHGKHVSYTDHAIFEQAQQQLLEEIAFGAHIRIEEADLYIRKKLGAITRQLNRNEAANQYAKKSSPRKG